MCMHVCVSILCTPLCVCVRFWRQGYCVAKFSISCIICSKNSCYQISIAYWQYFIHLYSYSYTYIHIYSMSINTYIRTELTNILAEFSIRIGLSCIKPPRLLLIKIHRILHHFFQKVHLFLANDKLLTLVRGTARLIFAYF